MSAVTVSPAISSRAFRASRRTRVFSVLTLLWVVAVGLRTVFAATANATLRADGEAAAATALVGSLFCAIVAALGAAVRYAGLRVDADGVSWGWTQIGFTLRASSLRAARLYRDAIALVPRRGMTTWCLGESDWHPFAEVKDAFRRSGLPLEEHPGRAPLLAKLQSYGTPLNVILLLDLVLQTGLSLLVG
jgi:hypothetical protein